MMLFCSEKRGFWNWEGVEWVKCNRKNVRVGIISPKQVCVNRESGKKFKRREKSEKRRVKRVGEGGGGGVKWNFRGILGKLRWGIVVFYIMW